MGSKVVDDVDRLFECFKCGISPPQSALGKRRRSKSKLKQSSSTSASAATVTAATPSPEPLGPRKKNAIDDNLSVDNVVSGSKANCFSRSKQISPGLFYGSPCGVPPKRPISLLRLLREIRVDLAEQQQPELSKEVWATFPRQNEAMNFAKEHVDVRVFSYQDHHNGQRRFLVSTYKEFWKRYKNMDPKFRHHYEVIQEGLPCHLYFDLEFNKRHNPETDGNEIVDLLISVILEALLEKYSIQGNQDWIVELDSSTTEKFSRHLIICIPKTAFKDNSHAGAFVSEICSRILSATSRDERYKKLFVHKESSSAEPPSQLFVDTAVYSRNRCFRLALSSKAGKSSFLLPTGRFKCKDLCEEDMFMASLICSMGNDCEKLLVCKMDLDCVKTLHFDAEVTCNAAQRNSTQELSVSCRRTDGSATYITGKSPFPALDNFVESIASNGSVLGKIRSWYWFSEFGLMVYSMLRNRYCERIDREHKSNHVIYVVDMRRGYYYQKCHDPDCQGYRSPTRPIPMDLVPYSLNLDDSAKLTNDIGRHQSVNNSCERVLLYQEECRSERCDIHSWWLEAVKVADNIESKESTCQELGNMDINVDDENWWMAVEMTASQAELMQST